jgi:hypothetical protein
MVITFSAGNEGIDSNSVAPGTWVLSTYSDLYRLRYDPATNPRNSDWQYDGWGFPYNIYYKHMGGTSMSNPLVAGGAAVIKDYFQKVYGITASAALLKAALVNTAVDQLDENNDGANDNGYPIPNNLEGWGRVNLATSTDGRVRYVEGSGLATNGTAYFTVTPTGRPLGRNLDGGRVWLDFPRAHYRPVLIDDEYLLPGLHRGECDEQVGKISIGCQLFYSSRQSLQRSGRTLWFGENVLQFSPNHRYNYLIGGISLAEAV